MFKTLKTMLGDIILYLNISHLPKLTESEKKVILEKIDEVKKTSSKLHKGKNF